MQRTNFGELACSIARTLDVIGEPWSPLILRDVWVGFTRCEQLQADLGISRKVLTERLNHLVERGVLERRPYDRRPRYEYVLTQKGTEPVDLLVVMGGGGDKGRPGARRTGRSFMNVRLVPWAETDLPLLRRVNTPEMRRHVGGPETEEQVLSRHR